MDLYKDRADKPWNAIEELSQRCTEKSTEIHWEIFTLLKTKPPQGESANSIWDYFDVKAWFLRIHFIPSGFCSYLDFSFNSSNFSRNDNFGLSFLLKFGNFPNLRRNLKFISHFVSLYETECILFPQAPMRGWPDKKKLFFFLDKKEYANGAHSQKTCPLSGGSRLTRKIFKFFVSLH